jgi:signal transduction histidine kinase
VSRLRVPARVAVASVLLGLVIVSAGAATGGYLIEAGHERSDRASRLATAVSFVEGGAGTATTKGWQQGLATELAKLGLTGRLTLVTQGMKRVLYVSPGQAARGSASQSRSAGNSGQPGAGISGGASAPTHSVAFPVSGGTLFLDLYAPPMSRSDALLAAFISGSAALILGSALMLWAASRWLVSPLRRLNNQVDAIAGGDRLEDEVASPVREVDNVARAVAAMGTKLIADAERAETRNVEREMLMVSIAHDLRTPLFSLRGYLDAIERGLGEPAERLAAALAKAEQVDRLVTSLFNYARTDLDAQPVLYRADVAEVVAQVAAAFGSAAENHSIRIAVESEPECVALIDLDSLERALANILDNALRHAPSAGFVQITCCTAGNEVIIRVVDNGPGFPPEVLARNFEPGAGADRRTQSGGLGLGLAIAARLTRSQGGTIQAANVPDGGASVTLIFARDSELSPRRSG